MKNCKVCGDETETVFNISLKAVPICEGCAATIFMQQANWFSKQMAAGAIVKNKTTECEIGAFEHNKSIFNLGQCHKCYSDKVI